MTRQTPPAAIGSLRTPAAAGALLRTVMEAGNFGLVALDTGGRIVAWNRWLAERTAVPEVQALGKTLSDALPGVPQTTLDLCAEVLQTGRPRLLSPPLHEPPIPFTKPSQQAGRLHPVYDGRGRVSGVVLIINDLSRAIEYERFAANEAVTERREREKIFQAIGHPALILDRGHNIVAANRATETLTGLAQGALVGQKCYRVMHGADAPPPGCPFERMVATGRLETEEMPIEMFDRVFLVSCTPLFDAAGNLERVIHIATDITDRKKADEALKARNEELAQLNRIAFDLASIPAGRGLFRYIACKLKALTGAATATFALYDADNQALRVEHAELDHGLITELFQALGGKKPTEATFPVSDNARRDLIQNPIRILGTLNEITFGAVPRWIGKLAQKVQGIDRFAGIAYVVDGELYGTTVLALRAGRPDPPREMLQSVANLAAVSLRRMQVEDALKLSEERYSAFVKQSSEAICLFGIEHAPIDAALSTEVQIDLLYAQAVIAECNRIFARSHGYGEPEEMIGFRIGQIFPRIASGNVEYLRAFIENGHRISDVETKELARDGSVRYFLNSLIGHVENGRLLRVWGAKQDITRIKRIEEEVRTLNAELERRVAERTLQLQTANKELEAFAYSVSHDLRAPLRAVDGFTHLLMEEFGPRLDAEGRRICTVISESARNMGRLIDDLLLFSRVGRSELNLFSIDMTALVEAIFLETTTPEQRGRIDFRIGPLPAGQGDPALIRQVWTNLIANAVKFSSKREQAVIEVGSAPEASGSASEAPPSASARPAYFIRDNGAGFDMAYAGKLFGVFQRLHSSKEFEGTGVGLAIVQRIIHRHGGRIWAEGDPGSGATFYFTL